MKGKHLVRAKTVEPRKYQGQQQKLYHPIDFSDYTELNETIKNDIRSLMENVLVIISRLNYNSMARSFNLRSTGQIIWLKSIDVGEMPQNPPRNLKALSELNERVLEEILNIYNLEVPISKAEKLKTLKDYLGFYEF